ncbi:hypothetical protein AB0E59_34590 [Lentzea sp. NPDC034063]|uniref:hypothetical protein n=1 Tax=unclassified Lentzea TaxID=2643253 RepID=UPI0033FBAE7C
MTVPPEAADAVSAADEAEYVALLLGDNDTAPTPYAGCGCVPVFLEAQGEPAPPLIPLARKEFQP